MKTYKYLKTFLKDFFMVSGFIMVVGTLFSVIYSIKIINVSHLYQIILVASAYSFIKLAFANKDELDKKVQMLFFVSSFAIAEMIIFLWLWFFSPGKFISNNLMIVYMIILSLVEGIVYIMMYRNGLRNAKLINDRLIEYKNDEMI